MCRLIMRVCLMGLGAGRGCLGCRYGGRTWRQGEWRGYLAATRLLSGYLADTWAFDRCPAGRFIHGNRTNVTTTNPSLPIPSHPISPITLLIPPTTFRSYTLYTQIIPTPIFPPPRTHPFAHMVYSADETDRGDLALAERGRKERQGGRRRCCG